MTVKSANEKSFRQAPAPDPGSLIRPSYSSGTNDDRTKLVSLPTANSPARKPGENLIDEGSSGKPVVLLVDDERTQRIVLRAALERDGFAVEDAEDGFTGLDAFDRIVPDLVLLDVRMPVMNGFLVCSAIRNRPLGKNVPVVMLTVLNDSDSIDRAYEVGATDFITKPVAWPILGRRLRYMLRASAAFKDLEKNEAELARRIAERTAALDESNRRLEDANRELEAFTYSVSHDLRAPLRAIDGYAELVSRDSALALSRESTDYLQRIRAVSGRMSRLIDDLLKLSMVARHAICKQHIDLSTLVTEIVDALRGANPQHRPKVTIEPGMRVNADPWLFRVALENLLGNAWKFTSRVPQPRIEVGKIEASGDPVCFVRDNGAGFDSQHAERLFAPFQRLHSQAEFEGSGIGLSIVQRIIVRHDGRVWAEAQEEQGATFFFSLPGTS